MEFFFVGTLTADVTQRRLADVLAKQQDVFDTDVFGADVFISKLVKSNRRTQSENNRPLRRLRQKNLPFKELFSRKRKKKKITKNLERQNLPPKVLLLTNRPLIGADNNRLRAWRGVGGGLSRNEDEKQE